MGRRQHEAQRLEDRLSSNHPEVTAVPSPAHPLPAAAWCGQRAARECEFVIGGFNATFSTLFGGVQFYARFALALRPASREAGRTSRRPRLPRPCAAHHALEALRVGGRPLPRLVARRPGWPFPDGPRDGLIGGCLDRRIGLGLGARSSRQGLVLVEAAVLVLAARPAVAGARCARDRERCWRSLRLLLPL
ncbi:MAG: hypothetical protein MZV70_07920 [Desulfobacterales bacterium]|nr:hypothetical protein [Desulfobacterales bacterium]